MPTTKPPGSSRVLSGYCPDEKCRTKLFFPSYDTSIECTNCGQRHERSSLQDVQEITDPNVALHNMIRNVVLGTSAPKKGTEMIKVLGLSNYHCKLLSPLLTRYGMDKKTGKARLLQEMNQGVVFDCSLLGDRCFLIDPEHVEVVGYGRDISGSTTYLADTLQMIRVFNGDKECLLPIHADGDGHCLVHAISRALVGRELFWHPLRTNLKEHFQNNLTKYKELFREFIDQSEWQGIIAECDPDFQPMEGEFLGLRNIHICGLANVLHRPIILLDSLRGMKSSGDYSATFLPGLVDSEKCRGKSGELNKPLCIAWSSSGRNHYIPLVGIKKSPLPKLHSSIVPKAWGMPQSLVAKYIDIDHEGFCIIGGDKYLQDTYILRLASAMEEVFIEKYQVSPALIADVHHFVYKRTGVVGVKPEEVLEATRKSVNERRLYRCLTCDAVCEQKLVTDWFKRGGALYMLAEQRHGKLRPDKMYTFPLQGVTCSYDSKNDELVPDGKETPIEKCSWCHGSQMRLVIGNGSIEYRNGDRTKTRTTSSYCNCGFKHYWDGKEFDNLPQLIPVTLEWGSKIFKEKVAWFQYESDTTQNSNVYEVALSLVQKHFPGVFGSERLVQKLVDQILEETKKPEEPCQSLPVESKDPPTDTSPNKIIISGHKVVHKEELTMSEAERLVRQRIEMNASVHQRRKSAERGQPTSQGPHSPLSSKVQSPTRIISGTSTPDSDACALLESNENHESATGSSSSWALSSPSHATQKAVRVVTSDGRQIRVILDPSLTYTAFQKKLESELDIPVNQQKIMYGFPPRELQPPLTGREDDPLPFSSGEKVSVEIIGNHPDKSKSEQHAPTTSYAESQDILLQRLQDFPNSSLDSLDAAIASLLLTTTLSGQNLWEHIQSMPHLFASGGLLYLQMKRDVGLVDGKHCRLPLLPDKVFRYSAANDRLELCLEPQGHFAVEPGVEERVLGQMRNQSGSNRGASVASTAQAILAGSSGAFLSKSQQILLSHVPFQGQGYSLSGKQCSTNTQKARSQQVSSTLDLDSEEQMDTGLPVEATKNPTTAGSLIESNPEPVNLPPMVRKGPGYSVLNPEVTNYHNANTEAFKALATRLQESLSQTEESSDVDADDNMVDDLS